MSPDSPTPEERPAAKRQSVLLAPIASAHLEESRRWVTRAAQLAAGGEAVVLSAGSCDEIPLDELAARFKRVVLQDPDRLALERGLARLSSEFRRKLELRVGDLTDTTRTLAEKLDAALAECADVDAGVETTARLVREHDPSGFLLDGRYNLVVASSAIDPLHVELARRVDERFAARFPGELERLHRSNPWKAEMFQLARRVEARFIHDLIELVADGGVIYLSEAVQVAFLRGTPSGQWQTEGSYQLLRSKDLGDYLDARFSIAERSRWQRVDSPPTRTGETGRLVDVQALLVRLSHPST